MSCQRSRWSQPMWPPVNWKGWPILSWLDDNEPSQARIQKCALEAPKAPTGVGSGKGLCPFPRKILACSPSKWCILMHSGARFRPTIVATMMLWHQQRSNENHENHSFISTLKPAKIVIPQKGRPRNFLCRLFGRGVSTPYPSPSEYGTEPSNLWLLSFLYFA